MRRKQILQAGASGNGRSVEAVSGGTELVGGLSGGEIDRVGWSFGAGRGPTPGRTWAAEACMLASLRATMADQEVLPLPAGRLASRPALPANPVEQGDGGSERAEASENDEKCLMRIRLAAGRHVVQESAAIVMGDQKRFRSCRPSRSG
jgi:hypothetical protein